MHPILFQIGNFPVATYGVMILVGVLAGLWLATRLARRLAMSPEPFFDLIFVAILSGLIGGRLFFILTNWNDFLADPLGMLLSRGGFVFLGGLLTGVAVVIYVIRRRKLPLFTVADVIAPALVLAHGFGRIGCNFAGCCYGRFCLPGQAPGLCVQYPLVFDAKHHPHELFNFAYFSQIQQGLIPQNALAPLPVLPIQLFEAAGNFIICGLLLLLWRRRTFSGLIFGAYLVLYSILRFTLEYWRGDLERGFLFGGTLSTSQGISLLTFAAGLALLWFRRRKGLEPIPGSLKPVNDPTRASAPPVKAK